ncbi:hypothetical protein SAMN05421810_105155 [Amycolatopsis arida]|uniref:Uncharacterized protein n=1 Tax=Amycolatopsis arida TaxID=587909 RepID=A0A1I5WK33_9PSEU|nr:hypothetical protein [Amycolatopsis arida]TDX92329.1 hypothetical protein CLV69_105174 [Amycolatopsis arida]SFQ20202.1 hypothetical protein SAMN05421810_105155 [Amycolatopsis arida]
MSTRTAAGDPGERVHSELRQALRTGPFPAALHLAIEASGFTLDQLQVWLAEHGARVSVPTLSYWRRGRSRPERPGSIHAVRLLEQVLELPADSLVSLLGPRRPRGRWIGHTPGSLDVGMLWDDTRPIELLNAVGAPPRSVLSRISAQVTITIDGERRARSVHLRELVRANVDRVSSCGVLYWAHEDPANPPALSGVRYCRVGRAQVDRPVGLIAAELILDRMLDAGEPALLEYEWHFSPGAPMVNYDHRVPEPVKEYVLQVRFEPGAVPARCRRYERRTVTAPEDGGRELWIGGSNTALVAEWDLPAGIVGMRWSWPDAGLVN